MENTISSLGLKLPWYSDEYLDSLQERFPQFKYFTRQELFKALYESVDRESPEYENMFEAQIEGVILSTGLHSKQEIKAKIGNDYDLILEADNKDVLDFLFTDIPKINADRLSLAILNIVEGVGSAYLVLGKIPISLQADGSIFAESNNIQKISFVTDQGLGKFSSHIHSGAPLLALSVDADVDGTGYAKLDIHLIKHHVNPNNEVSILHQKLLFKDFVELFNKADLDV